MLAPSGRALRITDGTNSVEVECHSDNTISLVLTYQGTKQTFCKDDDNLTMPSEGFGYCEEI